MHLLALTLPGNTDSIKRIAVIVLLALAVGMFLVGWLVQKVVLKLALLGVFLLLGVAIWSQRSSIADCASKVADAPTCSFFGFDVKVPAVPKPGG